MERFSANYAYTNNNFAIQNLHGSNNNNNKYYPIICVLKNILLRGCPTLMSEYLSSRLSNINIDIDKCFYGLIDKELPFWRSTIKGDIARNYFPARTFFEQGIPKYFGEYKFIQSLIIPEVKINDITQIQSKKFINQQVDFYLPQAKLVIEIDGQQHKLDELTRIGDTQRDEYLKKHGIITVRIPTKDWESKNKSFEEKINTITQRLNEYKENLSVYSKNYNSNIDELNDQYTVESLKATAIIRFEILILLLLEKNIINLKDKTWNINILESDVHNFVDLALEDLFIWLKNLCKLYKISFSKPQVNINFCNSKSEFNFSNEFVNIDFSILKRWTDEAKINPRIIYVRTDYFEDTNYFKISTSDPIKYKIINEGEEKSDIPALKFLLRNIFRFNKFAEGQLPIIVNTLSGRDTIGLLPTGAGKSLCYQFVCLLQPCVNFVVTPIKALMHDQKQNLDRRYITNINLICSDQSPEEKKKICDDFSKGKYLLIWISPERFQSKDFRNYLNALNKEQTIAFAVIDEVHCLSEWGHDFRTSYLHLSKTIMKYCPSTTFLGLTATASENVLKDIVAEFKVDRNDVKTLLTYTRPELYFKIFKDNGEDKKDKQRQLFNILNKLKENSDIFTLNDEQTKSGLIFTTFVNGSSGCYHIANELSRKYNTNAKWYCGSVPEEKTYDKQGKVISSKPVIKEELFDAYKQQVQNEYKDNIVPILVATKAFGMGIDKNNIRYTIHYGIPSSLESLYQEAGRAGRDKKKAACYVLYSQEIADKKDIDRLFELDTTIEEIQDIQVQYKKEARDILGNFFLWLSNNKGVNYEYKIASKVLYTYATPNKVKLVHCNKINVSAK